MKKLRRFLGVTGTIAALFMLTACGGGGGGGDTGGTTESGTLASPYILQLGQTYDITVMGEQLFCGETFNLGCPDFDLDYVSTKFTAPANGRYRLSVTGVAPGSDLVIFVYKSQSPTSTVIDYLATVDDLGSGGSETVEDDTLAGYYYYFFLQMWNAADTVQVKVEDVTPLLPPSNVAATNVTQNSALLTWQDNSSNESGFEIGTCLLVAVTGDGLYTCSSFTKVAETGANVTSYQINGLTSNKLYTYAVRAFNSGGVSANVAVSFSTP